MENHCLLSHQDYGWALLNTSYGMWGHRWPFSIILVSFSSPYTVLFWVLCGAWNLQLPSFNLELNRWRSLNFAILGISQRGCWTWSHLHVLLIGLGGIGLATKTQRAQVIMNPELSNWPNLILHPHNICNAVYASIHEGSSPKPLWLQSSTLLTWDSHSLPGKAETISSLTTKHTGESMSTEALLSL